MYTEKQMKSFSNVPHCAFCTKAQEGHCMNGRKTTYRNPKRNLMKRRRNCKSFVFDEVKLLKYIDSRRKIPATFRAPWYWIKGKEKYMVRDMFLKDPSLSHIVTAYPANKEKEK